MNIPEAAVEAAAREAFFVDDIGGHIRGRWTWETIPEDGRENYRKLALAVVAAAAPHMLAELPAQVWDEAMTRAAEIAWEHDASASSAITTTPNPYKPTP